MPSIPPSPAWRRYLRFWRPDPDADVDDELRTHLELRAAELRRGGMATADAERGALEEFGDLEATRRRLYAIDRRMARHRARALWWDAAWTDLRYALRGLRASPGLTAAVVTTIAVALAATATMFGVIDRLLLRAPPHVAAPSAVGHLHVTYRGRSGQERTSVGLPYGVLDVVREHASGLRAASSRLGELAIGAEATAEKATVAYVSPGYFSLLGAPPALGRWLTDEEAHQRSGARVTVLGHALWQRRFAADPAVLGRTVDMDGVPHVVVGVAPRGFHGATLTEVSAWLPMATLYAHSPRMFTHRGTRVFAVVVRRDPGVSPLQGAAMLQPVVQRYLEDTDELLRGETLRRATLLPLIAGMDGEMRWRPEARVVVWLTGVTGVLLLVACANVAGLLLLRAARRRHEFAVRLALGVRRGRLVAQLLTESLTLAVLGAVAALPLAVWGGAWLRRVLLPHVAWDVWVVDHRVLGVTAAAVLGAALLTGLAPALYAGRADLRRALAGAGRTRGAARPPLQRPLLVAQTALSLVLLVGAGLFLRSLHNLRTMDMGMEPHRVLAVSADFERAGWDASEAAAFLERAGGRLRGLPGVENVAVATNVPLESARGSTLRLPGRDTAAVRDAGSTARNDVSPGFFETMGTPLVQGRLLDERDARGAAPVLVVNETMARRFWPDASPLGQCLFVGDAPGCWTVVGVVRDARTFRIVEEQQLQYYLPLAQLPPTERPEVLLVRTAGDAAGQAGRVREALQEVAPEQPFLDVRSVEEAIAPEARPWRLGATVFTVYGAFALLLAALGLYSTVAYGVAMRTRELGIRIAVGARTRHVVGLVLRDAVVVGLAGLALGLPAALLLGDRVAGLLLDVAPRDVGVLAGAAALLAVTVLVAGAIPARRAARVDPMTSLRSE